MTDEPMGGMVSTDLVTRLLPILGRSLRAEFNVFDVMRHGTHEKQLSNVFAWLLEASGSHGLGDRFLRIFLTEVNRQSPRALLDLAEPYRVRQEVNTATAEPADIADIVLESASACVAVENYFTSDGHGHSYEGYLAFGERSRQRAVVVMLCADEDRSLLTGGWADAPVLTYGTLIDRLHAEIDADGRYRREHLEAHAFLVQLHRKFGLGRRPMEDRDVLDFVLAMCEAGESGRYGFKSQDAAAEAFANDVAQQAMERFGEGRVLLQKVKDRIRVYAESTLAPQLDAALGAGTVRSVKANWQGVYQWSVHLDLGEDQPITLTFGPSAVQLAIEDGVDGPIDVGQIYLRHKPSGQFTRSSVSIRDVLDGLPSGSIGLRDEVLALRRTNLP